MFSIDLVSASAIIAKVIIGLIFLYHFILLILFYDFGESKSLILYLFLFVCLDLLLENKTKEAHIPPLLGVAPLGPVPLQKEHQHQFQMMDAAHCHLPVSADSERMRQFLPRNPYPTPHYYPQVIIIYFHPMFFT
jgi:hypothetical protein